MPLIQSFIPHLLLTFFSSRFLRFLSFPEVSFPYNLFYYLFPSLFPFIFHSLFRPSTFSSTSFSSSYFFPCLQLVTFPSFHHFHISLTFFISFILALSVTIPSLLQLFLFFGYYTSFHLLLIILLSFFSSFPSGFLLCSNSLFFPTFFLLSIFDVSFFFFYLQLCSPDYFTVNKRL